MRNLLLSILFIAFVGLQAQNRMSLGFDAGAVINKPLITNEHMADDVGTTYSDFTYNYYTSAGSYFRAALDLRSKTKGKWQFLMPVSISYMQQVNSYHIKGWYAGCFAQGYYDETRTTRSSCVFSSIGLGTQYQTNKWRHALTLNINSAYTINSKIKTTDIDGITRVQTNPYPSFKTNFSGQFQSLFKLRQNVWIGPSLEVYFYDMNALVGVMKETFHQPSYRYTRSWAYEGLQGQQIWINPGIKIQWDLK